MRKPAIVMASFLLLSAIIPGTSFAAEVTKENTAKQTPVENKDNDAAQNTANQPQQQANATKSTSKKKNRIVNGIDLDKLTEDQLKYIPKAWRDGSDPNPSEHPEPAESPIMARSAVFPNVNNYIAQKGFKAVTPKMDYKNFPKFDYRYGRPEGVVAHETANDTSTITGEISYMTRNYNNAFVHAFVDANNVIQIHPTGKGAWGAGYVANQRFIHVELVRSSTFDGFARSINNYAEYIASLLFEYGLDVKSAEASGAGTLWSHNAVSKYLKGTNHTDPIGYFAKYGYTWGQFTQLVQDKYRTKLGDVSQTGLKTSKTSKLGHIRNASNTIYKTPGTATGAFAAGANYTNQVYYIKQQATLNGVTYYKISTQPSDTKGVIGWVKASDMSVNTHKGVDKVKKAFYVKGNLKAYTKAWGGSKDLVYNLADYQYELFEVNLTEAVGKNTWYRGTLAGKTVWIHSSGVEEGAGSNKEYKTSRLGHIKRNDVLIYHTPGNDATALTAGTKYTNQVYYIKKQAYHAGALYYLISQAPSATNGIVGWVKASDLTTYTHKGVDSNKKEFVVLGTGNAYSKAWGGSKDLVYDLSKYKDELFEVHLTERVGKNTWYRGTLRGKTVWIHSSYIKENKLVESATSRLGHIKSGNHKIYQTIGKESTAIPATSAYQNMVYYIKKQADYNGTLYYLISHNPSSTTGVVGWMKASDLSTHEHKGVDRKAKTATIKGTGNAYTKAWGGSKDLVYKLSNYKGSTFNIHLTERVGNNIWFRGVLNGKTVWIHSSYIVLK